MTCIFGRLILKARGLSSENKLFQAPILSRTHGEQPLVAIFKYPITNVRLEIVKQTLLQDF